jgi:hypothetical protein
MSRPSLRVANEGSFWGGGEDGGGGGGDEDGEMVLVLYFGKSLDVFVKTPATCEVEELQLEGGEDVGEGGGGLCGGGGGSCSWSRRSRGGGPRDDDAL